MKKVVVLPSMKYLIVGFFALLSANQFFAQNASVYELFEQDFQNTSQVSSKSVSKSTTYSKSSLDVREGFFNLKRDLKPTIYVTNNKITKVSGNSTPLILKYENSYSLEIINKNSSLIKNVELLTIKLKNQEDLVNRLDFSTVTDFNNLKYIYIQCNFKCTASQLSSFILNVDPRVTIFYMINNPS